MYKIAYSYLLEENMLKGRAVNKTLQG